MCKLRWRGLRVKKGSIQIKEINNILFITFQLETSPLKYLLNAHFNEPESRQRRAEPF